MNYKDKFNAQMKKAGINSLDDLKTDAEKKAFFKAVDKSHDAKNEELLTFAEEAINEFKLKDSDVEKLKQGVKQMPPMKGAKLGKPEKIKTANEEDVEEAMKKEMAKKEMMMKAMKTGEADAEPNAEMLNAMVKDPHKSKEDKPKKDMNAIYMKSDVRADVKNNGGADMSKVQDAPKMMTAMKKISAMYKTEKYHESKPGSLNDVLAQMHLNEQKSVSIKVQEFSSLVETYLAKGGVVGNITDCIKEVELNKSLRMGEEREFITTYNIHFLTNYRAEEFIIRDRLNEGSVTGLPKDRAIMYIIKTDRGTARRIKSFLADNGERYSMHIDDDDSGQITLDAYDKKDKDDAYDTAQAIAKKLNVNVRGTR